MNDLRSWLQRKLPLFILSPSVILLFVGVYVFIAVTIYLSFSDSEIFPSSNLIGFDNYTRLFKLKAWIVSLQNLAIFSSLYIFFSILIGLLLAILLDQRIRFEGFIRPIYLYPMALSFIVTGTIWKWFLDPGIGIEATMQAFGFADFSFNWIKNSDRVIYTIVTVAVWQTSGFVMAMFLAGLRGIDDEIIKAARIDGASSFQIYRRVVLPQLWPVFLSAFVILGHLAIKSYDLVIAMTSGGPGRASWLPSLFMYQYTFTRNQMAIGASSAVIMLMTIAAIMVPYIYAEIKRDKITN